jgi:hypothetical protein
MSSYKIDAMQRPFSRMLNAVVVQLFVKGFQGMAGIWKNLLIRFVSNRKAPLLPGRLPVDGLELRSATPAPPAKPKFQVQP